MKNLSADEFRKYLEDGEVQQRIQKSMLDARAKATVTISRAASLFGFTESQLREWERKGYFRTDRTPLTSEGRGHRQFSPEDLDKLALMRELMVEGGYSVGDVPTDIDIIWKQVGGKTQAQFPPVSRQEGYQPRESKPSLIDTWVDHADEEYFWRLFVSKIMRLTLLLISEEMPETIIGIILPMQRKGMSRISSPQDITQLGPSIIGWLGAGQAYYVSYHLSPSFEYPSDFRVEYLPFWDETRLVAPVIIIQRRARPIILAENQVGAIQRLFELMLKHEEHWLPCYTPGERPWIDHTTSFSITSVSDTLLNRMMTRIVELGGVVNECNRWKFSHLLLPEDPSLPLQQRTLRVRAHSEESPKTLASIELTVQRPGLTFRAYQSGHVFYRPHVVPKDSLVAYYDIEQTTQSAVAIPIAGPDGLISGAVYIASDEPDAFSPADLRALRFMTRILEEMLSTYLARQFSNNRLSEALASPRIVDKSFRGFLSEEQFIDELERLLEEIQQQPEEALQGKEVSFIVLDIDNQSTLATRYGDRVARNLSREVGTRMQGQLRLQSNPDYRKVYHVGADRYYIKLVGMPLDDARSLAEQLRLLLRGDYRVDGRRFMTSRPVSREDLLPLQNVTVRLGASNYVYPKLKQVLGRYAAEDAIAETRTLLLNNFTQSLDFGQRENGDCVVSWDYDKWGHIVWSRGEPGS